jgi:thioredoxin-related protein
MKIHHIIPILLLAGGFTISAQSSRDTNATASAATARPKIYDESADGSKQISDALVIAKQEGKHILLIFGDNGCGWCQRLHTLFETDQSIATILKRDYLVVMIDVNEGHHNMAIFAKYFNPEQDGIPGIVIVDADDKQLTINNTEELQEGHDYRPDKVMAFLKAWTPKT